MKDATSQASPSPITVAEDPNATPDRTAELPPEPARQFATRTKASADLSSKPNRTVLLAGAAAVIVLLLFVLVSIPGHKTKPGKPATTSRPAVDHTAGVDSDKSLFPITNSDQPVIKTPDGGFVGEQDLERTATRPAPAQPEVPSFPGGTLGSIPPFDSDQNNPPTPKPSSSDTGEQTIEKKQREEPSLVFVLKKESPELRNTDTNLLGPDSSLGLAVGTRLRAKLEATASTAVRTPVIAVIEYDYQKSGEIIVPAGAKALGHIEQADRSGYVSIRFDSLLMPDGSSSAFDAVATDLRLRPLKGRVEGKNAGKGVLVRSLSGIGQVGAVLLGRSGGLAGPLSEGDLVRERVGTNIGESADQEVARLSVTEHTVVSVDANTPIYVVVDRGPRPATRDSDRRPASGSLDSLRQILQLQRELNQSAATTQ